MDVHYKSIMIADFLQICQAIGAQIHAITCCGETTYCHQLL